MSLQTLLELYVAKFLHRHYFMRISSCEENVITYLKETVFVAG
jgi:hypothetical protein